MALNRFLFFVGFLLFCFTHTRYLEVLPGFHFDEAWASQHAWRIAFEKGFWPLDAMSVQTSPWMHYVSAAFFKVFGADLYVYRFSHFFLQALSIAFLATALSLEGYKKAAALLPLVAACFPALVHNHRFAIEITAFLPFCFALLMFSIALMRKNLYPRVSVFIFVAASWLGVTSHVFFVACLLALLLCWFFSTSQAQLSRQQVLAIAWLSALLMPFFIRILWNINWPLKALALLLLDLAIFVWVVALGGKVPRVLSKNKSLVWKILLLGSLPFAFNVAVFAEGHWTLFHQLGFVSGPTLWGALWVFVIVLELYSYKAKIERLPVLYLKYFACLLFCSGLIMITQANRYYEIPFLLLAVYLCLRFASLPTKVGLGFTLIFLFIGVFELQINYYQPGARAEGRLSDFRFGVLRDSSFDYLPKHIPFNQALSKGCDSPQIQISDPRLREVFKSYELMYKPYFGSQKSCSSGSRLEINDGRVIFTQS